MAASYLVMQSNKINVETTQYVMKMKTIIKFNGMKKIIISIVLWRYNIFIRKLVLLVEGSVLRDVKCWTSQVYIEWGNGYIIDNRRLKIM